MKAESKANATFSIVTASEPKRLSKAFSLGSDGTLHRQNGGILIDGAIKMQTVASLAELGGSLKRLSPAQAPIYGVPKTNATRVMSRKRYAAAGKPTSATTRTNDTFAWSKGAGVLMLDYDPPDIGTALDKDGLAAAIREAAPGAARQTG